MTSPLKIAALFAVTMGTSLPAFAQNRDQGVRLMEFPGKTDYVARTCQNDGELPAPVLNKVGVLCELYDAALLWRAERSDECNQSWFGRSQCESGADRRLTGYIKDIFGCMTDAGCRQENDGSININRRYVEGSNTFVEFHRN